MGLSEFVEACLRGGFVDNDGVGYYSDGKTVGAEAVCPSDVVCGLTNHECSHVVWFNK